MERSAASADARIRAIDSVAHRTARAQVTELPPRKWKTCCCPDRHPHSPVCWPGSNHARRANKTSRRSAHD
ncbi:MAG: hypothetical protein DWI12_05470 [Planctomycetota bacterium]|nr:MAG: hypothetical protein DWI12_05470 [Planctomycetota bacterium]